MKLRQITRPRSFIFTLFGDVIRHYGGEIWIGSLNRLMGEFGLSEQAVRAAVSRMARQNWLRARKVGNKSYYSLTEMGRRRIDQASPRIYHDSSASWDGRWRILTYSIPERQRTLRDRCRKELVFLGCAMLSPSVWLAPHDVSEQFREAAEALGVAERIDLFVADYAGPHDERALVAKCWDLPAIERAYRAFIEEYRPRLERARAAHGEPAESACFVEREWLVHDYRKFLYLDPGLPDRVLPAGWPRAEAVAIFNEYYRLLLPLATRFFEDVYRAAPGGATPKPNAAPSAISSRKTAAAQPTPR
ncbi:MAG TPA: PaaX family transcriptional regulator C-terminal domain-containing protein [Candidatus Dormibacteraeota bacterium]|nr:PaaX family transcriptional regulator C-terminal domain-containing protein [Candidatus Dormibacteraeota bacterium]